MKPLQVNCLCLFVYMLSFVLFEGTDRLLLPIGREDHSILRGLISSLNLVGVVFEVIITIDFNILAKFK